MIGQQALRTKKKKHTLEKFEGEFSVWTKPALEPDRWGQPAPGKTLTRKKERKKSENWKPVKDKYSSNYFPPTILKYWKVVCILKKEKL